MSQDDKLVRDDEGFREALDAVEVNEADDLWSTNGPVAPCVGDAVQLVPRDGDPRPGQIAVVYDPENLGGMCDVLAWNPESGNHRMHKAVYHGPGQGFPFWVYPGESTVKSE